MRIQSPAGRQVKARNLPGALPYPCIAAIFCGMIALSGCRGTQKVGGGSEAPKAQDLVNIHEAPGICPDRLCPVGTEIYRKNGKLLGVVFENAGAPVLTSSKPVMKLRKPGETSAALLNADETKYYYVVRR